jgi:hypothetical protein
MNSGTVEMNIRAIYVGAFVLALSACGGGGGDPGTNQFAPNTTTPDTGTTTPTTPTATPSQASSITFVSATPAGTALAVRGAGGNGRTESGVLTFKVVSASGVAVSGATVNFSLNTGTDASLPAATGVTGSTGDVSVTVQSGVISGPVVVVATVAGVTGVTTLSDSIQVSNGLAIAAGFELVAEKYNLDGGFTGDSTNLTIFARDANGNPVADGLAVSFTTDFGVVATSTLGGCTTVNGRCSAVFRVQDPRGASGIATVQARALVGAATQLVDAVPIHMASPAGTNYVATLNDLVPTLLTTVGVSAGQNCSTSSEYLLNDGTGHAVAAGSIIAVVAPSSGVTASILLGSPVLDQLSDGFPANRFLMTVATSAITPATTPASCATGRFTLTFTTPNGLTSSQTVQVVDLP